MFNFWERGNLVATLASATILITCLQPTMHAEEVATAVEAEAEKVEPQIVKLADGKILLPVPIGKPSNHAAELSIMNFRSQRPRVIKPPGA